MKAEYYHCTTSDNLSKIRKDGWIGVQYYDGFGFYIAENIHECQYFGDKVIVIDSCILHEDLLYIDDVNDGIFYKGCVPIEMTDVYDTDEYLEFVQLLPH